MILTRKRHQAELDAEHKARQQDRDGFEQSLRLVSEHYRVALQDQQTRLHAELERAHAEIERLRAHELALLDRLCLVQRTLPVSEPLREAPKANGSADVQDLIDRSVRRSGPVATARQEAEAARAQQYAQAEAARLRAAERSLPNQPAAAIATARALEEMNGLQEE